MSRKNSPVSIILPTYCEAKNIVPLVQAIQNSLLNTKKEILIVDDYSPDNTAGIARKRFGKDKSIKIYIRKRRGLAGAILFGLKKARGKYVCVMDTDFNHDPKELPKMMKILNNADLVVGSRYVKGGGMENRLRNYLSRIYNRIIKFVLHLPTCDNLSGFFMAKREKLTYLLNAQIFQGYGDYFIRFLYQANKQGLKIREIPVYYKNRIHGVSKSKFTSMLSEYSGTVFELIFKTK